MLLTKHTPPALCFSDLLLMCLSHCYLDCADTSSSTVAAQPLQLHIYLRNWPHLDTAKGYWLFASIIGPLRAQGGVRRHIHSFLIPSLAFRNNPFTLSTDSQLSSAPYLSCSSTLIKGNHVVEKKVWQLFLNYTFCLLFQQCPHWDGNNGKVCRSLPWCFIIHWHTFYFYKV